MNSANGGNVIYHFKGDTKDLDKATKEAQGKLSGLGSVGKGALLGVAAAVGAATTAVVSLTKKSVQAYAEFEQLRGGLVSMMKGDTDAINRVLKTSKTAYRDLQMSQNDYLTSFESSYAIIQNGLSENADAITYTNKVLQLSADLFNTFGGSTEQYSNAINWALKGTYSYLDNLNIGIKGTQEGFIEAANASGVLGREIKSVKDITNDEIIDVIQHYADKAGAWGKSQQEASTTIIGSINMAKAAYNDFLSGQGGIEQVISSTVAAGKNISKTVLKLLPQVVEGLIGLINGLMPQLPGLVKRLLPVLVKGVGDLIKGIVAILPDLINVIAEVLPDMMPMIVDAIYEIIPLLIKLTPQFLMAAVKLISAFIQGFINSMPKVLQATRNLINSAINAIVNLKSQFLQKGKEIIINLVNGIKSVAENPKQAVRNLITNIKNLFSGAGGWLWNAGYNIIQGLLNGIVNRAGAVINYAQNLANRIKNTISRALKIHSPSQITMWQGEMTAEGYMVGLEKMKNQLEDAVFDTFALSPQFTNASALHYSPSVIVNNNVSMETDPLGQTVSKIKTFAGGAKNDYNYGVGV